MRPVEMLNKVSSIMDYLQSETREFDFYDKCVRIVVRDTKYNNSLIEEMRKDDVHE